MPETNPNFPGKGSVLFALLAVILTIAIPQPNTALAGGEGGNRREVINTPQDNPSTSIQENIEYLRQDLKECMAQKNSQAKNVEAAEHKLYRLNEATLLGDYTGGSQNDYSGDAQDAKREIRRAKRVLKRICNTCELLKKKLERLERIN